jgi:hypothetical protein
MASASDPFPLNSLEEANTKEEQMSEDSSGGGIEIVASKIKAKNSYGQNGFQGASSLLPGQTKANIPNVSPPTAVLPAQRGAHETLEEVNHALTAQTGISIAPVKPVPEVGASMHKNYSGSPSGTVPSNGRPVTRR